MKESLWTNTISHAPHQTDTTKRSVEVAVIGGGMAGILTAYFLQEQGFKVEVFEANTVGSGITANTTAKITSQHRLIYDRLITQYGIKKAMEYASRNEQAILQYENLIRTKQIECDFKKESAYTYTTKDTANIKKEVEAAKRLGITAYYTNQTALPFEVTGAVCFQNQASFHPLKFLERVAMPLRVNEHSKVVRIRKNVLDIIYDSGYDREMYQVKAKYIILTSHYPFVNFPGYYFTKLHQERSYIVAVKETEGLKYGMYIGECDKDLSFRRYKDYILIGGEGHRTGKEVNKEHYKPLLDAANTYYKDAPVEHMWSSQDCMALDEIPYIGHFSKRRPNIYLATGFNKWGMSTAMVAAQIIKEELCGKKNEDSVFMPSRFSYKPCKKKLKTNLSISANRWTMEKLHIPKEGISSLKTGEGKIVWDKGRRVAAYKDESGKIYKLSAKCPHLGCLLAWNQEEKSWDCPCHGSRFEYTGKEISNPATLNLKNRN